MKYAKFENGMITFAPSKVVHGDYIVFNPTENILLELGYKPVRYTDQPEPESGFFCVSSWEETETEIVQVWSTQLIPEKEPTTWENVYDASQTAPQMQAGRFYQLGFITEAMSYTLLPGTGDYWRFSFMTGSTAPQVTHPVGVLCSDFTVSANCLHEISIRKESNTYYALTFRKWEIPTAS